MRFNRWAVIGTAVLVVTFGAAGCGGSDKPKAKASATASPSPSTSPSLVTPSVAPSASTASPSPSASVIAPRNVVTLQGDAPKALPSHDYAVSNGNDYPKLVFLVLRDVNKADGATVPVDLKFGQIATDEHIDCGDKVYGGTYANKDAAAVWCIKYQLLLTAPGVIIADHGNDNWGVLRDMIAAFSAAQLAPSSYGEAENGSIACYSGRTIRSLREHGYLTGPDASSLIRSYSDFDVTSKNLPPRVWQGFAEARCA